MKILAINGSPKGQRSNTGFILTPFLQGMEAAGAETELIYTNKLQINPCRGELRCWLKTPGECYQEDDMQLLYPILQEADVWVFATPVYVDGMVGPLKNLTDRLIPFLLPFFELRQGHCRHVLPVEHNRGQVVLVANCGFWEMDNFDPLLAHMEAICKNMSKQFAGALLRPHGEAMWPMKKRGIALDDVFEAAWEAGRQLVRDGAMAPETVEVVSRELLPLEQYVAEINRNFERIMIKRGLNAALEDTP
jgi:multimeric flavodoxin WrbA